jgi:hypothetical protein
LHSICSYELLAKDRKFQFKPQPVSTQSLSTHDIVHDLSHEITDVKGNAGESGADLASSPTPRQFDVIVCDECHKLKSSDTERAKVVLPMLKKAKRVILLSGTPMLNRPEELFTQVVKRAYCKTGE